METPETPLDLPLKSSYRESYLLSDMCPLLQELVGLTVSDENYEDWSCDTVQDIEPLVPVVVIFIGVYHRHSQRQQQSSWTLQCNKQETITC